MPRVLEVMKQMAIKQIIVYDLGGYMNAVSEIADNICIIEKRNAMIPPILWFRGLSNLSHALIPSIFRTGTRAGRIQSDMNYTSLHHAEDIRTQHYIAKNFHLLEAEPSSRVEWLEVMQHHQLNTRVLDWSESSIHSLLFAIEAFFDGQRFSAEKRQKCVPCVWVLDPQKLNKKILEMIAADTNLQESLIEQLDFSKTDQTNIINMMQKHCSFESYAESKETKHIDYIFNLSSINDDLFRNGSKFKSILKVGEGMNPYYFFLSRIYSDGYLLGNRKLPPLCVVHPYHSERIKAQKGVFSIFPFYEEQSGDEKLRKFGYNPDAMEYNAVARECLTQILIRNPQKIALQLMQNGMNDSWLYPEMPIVSSEIENHRIF